MPYLFSFSVQAFLPKKETNCFLAIYSTLISNFDCVVSNSVGVSIKAFEEVVKVSF